MLNRSPSRAYEKVPPGLATAQPSSKRSLPALAAIVYPFPVFMPRNAAQLEEKRAASHNPEAAGKPAAFVRIAEFALLAAVVAGVIDTLRFAAYFVRQPFALNYQEGNDLLAALRITQGLTPYPPVGKPPYIVNVYGPVYYYAIAPLLKLFGLSFTAPRLLVLASALAVALFLILLLRRWTKSWVIALGFGLSFLAVSMVRDWVYVLRVELLATALSLAGLYIFATKRSLVWPALLFLAALYAKITFLAAPVACILYLWLGGEERTPSGKAAERRRAWRFTAWMLLFGTAGLLALGIGTNWWALFDMFLTHPDPYRLKWFFERIGPFARLDTGLVAGAIVLAVRDIRRRALSLPFLYCALATLVTLTAGKSASDVNELLEWQAAICLAAGCGYSALRKHWRSDPVVALIPIGVLVLVLLGLSESRRVSPVLSGCPAAYHFAARQPGQLLSENSGASVLSGKKVWLSSTFEFAFLRQAGRLDQQPLVHLVQQRFFGVILLGNNLPELERAVSPSRYGIVVWPAPFVNALADNYHQVASFSCAYANAAFEPNSKPRAPTGPHH